MIEIENLFGKAAKAYADKLAHLRIGIFREYPYLYDGCVDYEKKYLSGYFSSPRSLLVLARENGNIVGASTAMPMDEAEEVFRKPFENARLATAGTFYFGESVLLSESRGKGIGHRFFDEREAHAVHSGFKQAAFCSVIRPDDHPLKPAGHRSHDAFWRKRGYRPNPEMIVELPWREVSSKAELSHSLVFWGRDLV